MAGCGGSTQPLSPRAADAGIDDGRASPPAPPDASEPTDASSDASPYLACMNATGQVSDTLKTCQNDSQCAIEPEQVDCCGTILWVGINTASALEFEACQPSWLAHFPGCGCASNQTRTEDGTVSYLGMDAAAPQVACGAGSAGGLCLTYTP